MICHNICKYTAQNDQKKQEQGKYLVSLSAFPEMFFSVFQIHTASTRHQLPEKAQLLKASGQLPYPHLRILHSWIDLFIDSLVQQSCLKIR